MDIIEACQVGHLERVKELLKNGVDPSINNNWAITTACAYGHANIVEMLLQDERVNPADQNNTAIRSASYFGNANIVKLLLLNGRVDPTVDWNAAIRRASARGHKKVVEVLLQDGRVEATDLAINYADTDEIKEMLIAYKYRVDGQEYRRMKEQN